MPMKAYHTHPPSLKLNEIKKGQKPKVKKEDIFKTLRVTVLLSKGINTFTSCAFQMLMSCYAHKNDCTNSD